MRPSPPQPERPGAAMRPSAASADEAAPALPQHLLRGARERAPDAGPSKKFKPPVSRVGGTPPC
jgi:hypothetical protein